MKVKSLLLGLFALASLSAWSLDLNFGTPGSPNQSSKMDVAVSDDGVATLTVTDASDPWAFTSRLGTTLSSASNEITFEYQSTGAFAFEFFVCVDGGPAGGKELTPQNNSNPNFTATDEWTTMTVSLTKGINDWGFGTSATHFLRFDPINAANGTVIKIRNMRIPGTDNPEPPMPTSSTLKVGYKTVINATSYDEGGEGVGFHWGKADPYLTGAQSGRTDGSDAIVHIVPTNWSNGKGVGNMGAGWDSKYTGTVSADGGITWADAVNERGSWFNYTFTADENVDAEIDLAANIDYATFKAITGGQKDGFGSVYNYYTDMDGNKVEGCYTQTYSACAYVTLDGEVLTSTQDALPDMQSISSAAAYTTAAKDETHAGWIDNADKRILHILPYPTAPAGRSAMPLQQEKFGKPFFEKVHIRQGKHVLRVYGLASQFDFGGIQIISSTWTGIENVNAAENNVKVYAGVGTIYSSVPATVYNIAGAQVAKVNGTVSVPAGLYIVKAGAKAVKVLVK